jgi:oligopeptide/dipeptide ABC transporter ATP-binding protein
MAEILLETRGLQKYFSVGRGHKLHAVDGVNLQVAKGATLGVVGESGCGKTTLGRTVLGLLPATGGSVTFAGREVTRLSPRDSRALRREMQIIFQDPYSSINPRHSISKTIAEPLLVNGIEPNKRRREQRVLELMETVGLAARLKDSYPHELDGGRRQRVGIARALAVNPRFIVCDEPVSALDVSIQAQVLNLLMDLQESRGLTYMFITHNLSVVRHISTEIAVMYLGQCVERAPAKALFSHPLHPYTKALLSAIPIASAKAREVETEIIRGEITSPIDPVPGCRFAGRCPHAETRCTGADIPLADMGDGHFVACTLHTK